MRNKLMMIAMLSVVILAMSCESEDTEPEITTLEFVQVASGQTTLYNNDGEIISSLYEGEALYGQDGNYVMGTEMTYQDNGDGTVTDLNTGLMWEQVPDPIGFNWQDAADYCNELELGGYSDWRMPNIKELFSISDFSAGWPYLNTEYFSLASGELSKDEQFWSSNKYAGVTVEGGDNSAFGVNHVTGHIKTYPADMIEMEMPGPIEGDSAMPPSPPGGDGGAPMGNPAFKFVRAVRGDTYGVNKFFDNEDGTISDNASGLMWAQADNGMGLDWEDALNYAENTELAGYTDWRMPNVKELQGIVDYSYAMSSKDMEKQRAAINPMFSCTQITNESGAADYGYYWTGTSANFTSGEPYYYAWYVAFGRAVNNAGKDFHGAGGVRFDTKYEGGPLGEGGERFYNYVRLVRNID